MSDAKNDPLNSKQREQASCRLSGELVHDDTSVREKERRSTCQSNPENSPAAGFRIRCPHCRRVLFLAVDDPLTDIACGNCQTQFNVIDESSGHQNERILTTVGHFEILERIGIGGFGTVWKARDVELDRIVALKIPRQSYLDEEEINKFLREARSGAQLNHANIVPVFEIGRDENTIYIVSKFVEGKTLSERALDEPPSVKQSARLLESMARGLQHAHDQGVIHRDLKPQNIMVNADDVPLIMDFGLARRELGEITMTLDGQILGTPAYMSPEQAKGDSHAADRKSDIYSLGVIFFELLTGELPFRGNPQTLIGQTIHDDPPSPATLNPAVPKDIETICLKCMEKEPGIRYSTAQDLADDLQRYLNDTPIIARPVGRLVRTFRWCRRKPAIAGLSAAICAAIVLLVLGGIVSMSMLSSRNIKLQQAIDDERAERQIQSDVTDFFVSVFRSPAPRKEGIDVTVAERLLAAEELVQTKLAGEPLIAARFLLAVGETYQGIGQPKDAIRVLKQSSEMLRIHRGKAHQDTLLSYYTLALALRDNSQFPAALDVIQTTFEMMKKHLGANDRRTLACMNDLADILECNDKVEQSLDLYQSTLSLMNDHLEPDDPLIGQTMNGQAVTIHKSQGEEAAFPFIENTYEHQLAVNGPAHIDTMNALHQLACIEKGLAEGLRLDHQAANKHDDLFAESIEKFEQVINWCNQELSENHLMTLTARYNYSFALFKTGQDQQCFQELKDVLDRCRTHLGNGHVQTKNTLIRYTRWLASRSRMEEAKTILDDVYRDVTTASIDDLTSQELLLLEAIATRFVLMYRQENFRDPENEAKWIQRHDRFESQRELNEN